jgi:uncharacterized protein (DUF1810 family)
MLVERRIVLSFKTRTKASGMSMVWPEIASWTWRPVKRLPAMSRLRERAPAWSEVALLGGVLWICARQLGEPLSRAARRARIKVGPEGMEKKLEIASFPLFGWIALAVQIIKRNLWK